MGEGTTKPRNVIQRGKKREMIKGGQVSRKKGQ